MSDVLQRLNTIQDNLRKASDRIKSGVRTDRDTKITTDEALNSIKKLMGGKNVSGDTKKALANIHKLMTERAEKERIAAMSAKSKPLEIGERGKQATAAKQGLREQIAEHVSQNAPTQVKELGHAEQYATDQAGGARPRTAGQLTGPVRERMATGEGIAVPSKKLGQDLDVQRQLKEKAAQLKEAKGPGAVIRVPKRYHEDDQINEMMHLKDTMGPEHHADLDQHINQRLAEIGSKKGA